MPLKTLASMHPEVCMFACDGEERDQDSRGWGVWGKIWAYLWIKGTGRGALENTRWEERIEEKSPGESLEERFAQRLRERIYLGVGKGGNHTVFLIRGKKDNWKWNLLGKMKDICVRWPQFSRQGVRGLGFGWRKFAESRKCLGQKVK